MNASIDEHDLDWARRHLVGRALGLLDDAEEERFAALVESSAECRSLWEEFRGETPAEGALAGHLPASLIARWDRARLRLRGMEREMVTHHLSLCEQCRSDLELLGQAPTLDLPEVATAKPAATPRAGFDLRSLLFGLVGGGAIAAAALTFFVGGPSTEPMLPGTVPWVTPTSLRGATAAELEVGSDQPIATVLVEVPLNFAIDRAATLKVLSPDGSVWIEDEIVATAVAQGLVLGVLERGSGWVEGRYTVRLEQASLGDTPAERADSSFDLLLR